jgi:hypothetical protein
MKQSFVKGFPLICLCLALLGLPVLLGACGLTGKIDMGTPAPLGASRNPYVISAAQGICTAWSITLDKVGGKPWCASTIPASMHVGDNVRLSLGILFQDFTVTSLDVSQHHMTLGSIG